MSKSAIDRGNRPADRENEGASQIKNRHERFDGDHDRLARESLECRMKARSGTGSPIRKPV